MKICFITNLLDQNIGSYRIWIKDLIDNLKKKTHTQVFLFSPENFNNNNNYDAIFFGKDIGFKDIKKISRLSPNSTTICINPPFQSDYKTDFALVGSIEEEISLPNYECIFFPLIEFPFFENQVRYQKKNNDSVYNIVIHGNSSHLLHFKKYNFKSVLSNVVKKINKNLKLTIITEKNPAYLKKNNFTSDDYETEFFIYDYNLLPNILKKQDCGIVLSSFSNNYDLFLNRSLRDLFIDNLGKNSINLIFKNKTNFGRLFLLWQFNILAISDLSLSNLSLYDYKKPNMLIVNSENQLEKAIIKSNDQNFKNEMIQNAVITRDYWKDVDFFVNQLIKRIKK